jgi:hypothetical protein
MGILPMSSLLSMLCLRKIKEETEEATNHGQDAHGTHGQDGHATKC